MKQYQIVILGTVGILNTQAYEMYSRSTNDSIK